MGKAQEFFDKTDFHNLTKDKQEEVLDYFIDNNFILPEKKIYEEKVKEFTAKATKHGYPDQMIIDFCDYWTEKNERGKKMRYEMQPIFDMAKRLRRWELNSKGRYKNGTNRYSVGEQDYTKKLS